jgi:hypothetical protein
LSPTRPVSLELNGRSIHRGFKQAIRESIHGSHLLEAMQLRYDWSDGTLELIDWDPHRQALQTQHNRRTHFVKMCHNILPTGNIVGRYGQGLPSHCQLCKTPEEDFHHVLRCPHQSRQTWRSEFLSSLRKKCHSIATDQALTDILLIGIESWLNATAPDFSTIPTLYDHVIRDQTQIGWNHIFQGRFAISWSSMQQQHYSGLKPVKGRDGQFWTRTIISHIFTHWITLWEARNKSVHGNDTSTMAKAKHDQAIRELEILYSFRDRVLHRDRSLFFEDLSIHKDKPTFSIRQWLNSFKTLILQSMKEAKTKSLSNVHTLDHYFKVH